MYNVFQTKSFTLYEKEKFKVVEFYSPWCLQRESHSRQTREKSQDSTIILININSYKPSTSVAVFSEPVSSSWSWKPLRHHIFSFLEPFCSLSKSTCNKENYEFLVTEVSWWRTSILTRKIYLYCKWEGSDLGSGWYTVRVRGEAGHFWKTHQFILMLDNIKIFSQMLWRDLNTLRALSLKLN